MDRHRLVVGRASATAVAVLLLASCGSGASCDPPASKAASCPDLSFGGRSYDEWRPFRAPGILQELGDATYPVCNAAPSCGGGAGHGDVGAHGATDVWRLEGVDPTRAVIGLRQDSNTKVVFVRSGVDPATLHPSVRISGPGG